MIHPRFFAALALPLVLAATPATKPTTAEILTHAADTEWADIAPEDLLVIDMGPGRRVVIWLASSFAPAHIANIRLIARSGWWSDATVYRVQDNYVAQWGDASEKKPPAPGINPTPPAEYLWDPHAIIRNPWRDAYARVTGFTVDGWAVAGDGRKQWLPHCYGAVGVARNLAPDTGTGGDLYAVIGHAPRHLDRNIAVIGRVIAGIEWLSSLPRGHGGALGLYEDPGQRVPIARTAIASDLHAGEQPHWQYLKPDAPSFAPYLDSKANRQPPFFTVPADAADLCNLPVPVRKIDDASARGR